MPARILIAEDNPDARELIDIVLKEEGFEVISAEDGQIALEAAKSRRPDLIITDIQMPNFDGIDLIKALRGLPDLANVPVLVITANNSGIIEDAIDAGANAAASKPVELDALIRLIRSLITSVGLVFLFHSHSLNIAIWSVEDFLRPLV